MASLDYYMYGIITIPTCNVVAVRAAFDQFLATSARDDTDGEVDCGPDQDGFSRVSVSVNCRIGEYIDASLDLLSETLKTATSIPGFLTLRCCDFCSQENDYRSLLVGDVNVASAMYAVDRLSEAKSIDVELSKKLVDVLTGQAVIVTNRDGPRGVLTHLRACGMEFSECVHAFAADSEHQQDAANVAKESFATTDVAFDPTPVVADGEGGSWVSSWHWIPDNERDTEPSVQIGESALATA